jgi:endo-1,4-beta-xylanase
MSDRKNNLFEATDVYQVPGSDQYLLIQEAIASDWRRYFEFLTSSSLTGSRTPLDATENEPFRGLRTGDPLPPDAPHPSPQ